MSETSTHGEPRPTCARCLRPSQLCYCALVPTLEARTRVVILQHPRERHVAIGTARMASLCVPSAELHVGARWSEDALARILGEHAADAVLLYPGEGATDVAALAHDRPRTLVVIDGTWSHAKGVVRDCPAIAALPRVSFVPPAPSEYRIRREPRADYVSTIEALVHVLGTLERDPARFTPMLAPFRAMIDAQVDHATRLHTPRVRKKAALRAPRRAPPPIEEGWDRLVVVAVEASAWSYGTPERARDPLGELVHVVAERVATGERLDRVVAPTRPLAPGTTTHSELDADTIAAGQDVAGLSAAWRALVREDDVVVHWGPHAPRMLVASGVCASQTLDLRDVLRRLESRRAGTVEHACAVRGLVPDADVGRGRAGRRVAALAALARYVRASYRSTERSIGSSA